MRSKLNRIENWEALARDAGFCTKSLAGLCGISLRQLERYCQWAFKESPREYVQRLRIEAARRYLSEGCSVKATAYELGFKRPSHFSRVFKRATGISPAAFVFLSPARESPVNVALGYSMSLLDMPHQLSLRLEGA